MVHLLLQKLMEIKGFFSKRKLKGTEDEIWGFFLQLKGSFQEEILYFHHMVETDGVSVSLLLKRKDLVGKNNCRGRKRLIQ